MTVLLPCGRTLSKQLLPRSALLTRLATTHPSSRVSHSNGRDSTSDQSQNAVTRSIAFSLPIRTYATAAKPAGRPKAHTGRTTTKTKTPKKTITKKTAAKPGVKKAAPKKKKKVKAKAKAKPIPKTKKPLSAAGLARRQATERTELKKKALLNEAPKTLPATAWAVCFVEHAPKKGEVTGLSSEHAKRASQAYKGMSAAEHERLNQIANENKAKNETAYKRWVQKYTPLQIKDANNARNMLKRMAKASGDKNKRVARFSHIKDDRLVKQAPNPYAIFTKERHASGDMNGMQVKESAALIAREYKALSASDKKAYQADYAADRNRYFGEYKTVYGIDSPASPTGKAASAA